MQSLDWFQTIGAGLASIITMILLWRHVSSFVTKLRTKLMVRWRRYRMFRLFYKYCPTWEIVDFTPLKVSRVDNAFKLDFSMDVKYVSRDARYHTIMDCNSILIDIYHRGKDREKRPYRLHSRLEEGIWSLPPLGERTIRYDFSVGEPALPLLDEQTICHVINIGEAQVGKLPFRPGLKAGQKFKIHVVKEDNYGE